MFVAIITANAMILSRWPAQSPPEAFEMPMPISVIVIEADNAKIEWMQSLLV